MPDIPMPTYVKRGSSWRVQIRKYGQSYSATFPLKAQCVEWASKLEADLIDGKLGRIPDKTFNDLVERYRKEVTPTKRGSRAEDLRLSRCIPQEIADTRLSNFTAETVSRWRDIRLQTVSSASVNREWNTLSHVCTVAVKEWKWLRENPFHLSKRPAKPPPRTRLITDEEIEAIKHATGIDPATAMGRVGLAFIFALETALRAGEICSIRKEHDHGTYVHIPKTKNGFPRDVPLSKTARKILDSVDGDFKLNPTSRDALFRKAKEMGQVSGFTFHDARAVALTRLSKVLNVMQLAKVSGHRDLRILSNVYYRETAEDISRLLDQHAPTVP